MQDRYAAPPQFTVSFSAVAEEQLRWIEARNVSFRGRAVEILSRDPSENRSRRIKRHDENLFRLGCAEWRVFFTVQGFDVTIRFIRTGYTMELLLAPGAEVIRNRETLLAFFERWPEANYPSTNPIR